MGQSQWVGLYWTHYSIDMYYRDFGHSRNGNLRRCKIYNTWLRMRHRCLGKSKDAFYYRDRGIAICDEWRDDYDAFRSWAIKQGVTRYLTLDRIDNDRGYSPDNCRWITQAEQNRNKRYVVKPRPRKIAREQIAALRLRRMAGESLGVLAAEYGVTSGHICKLVGRVTNKGRWPKGISLTGDSER